jgi:hypothetical protein
MSLLIKDQGLYLTCLCIQDGRIDYNEFVTMMQKGNNPLGKKGHAQMSFGLREALKLG